MKVGNFQPIILGILTLIFTNRRCFNRTTARLPSSALGDHPVANREGNLQAVSCPQGRNPET